MVGIDARLVEIFDIDDATVAESPWAFADINAVGWAQAARLATDICIQRGFVGGFFTGHQVPNKRQIAALRHDDRTTSLRTTNLVSSGPGNYAAIWHRGRWHTV
jgi:hypothetical protein